MPRSYRLPYTRPLADKSLKARDEIMSGNPQEGTADDLTANETPPGGAMPNIPDNANAPQPGAANVDLSQLKLLRGCAAGGIQAHAGPLLPAKE